jgi:hypothetical protein
MKTTEQQIAIMQAFIDGKAVQYRKRGVGSDAWYAIEKPKWDWDHCEYRVKPEPKTVMMQMWRNSEGYDAAYPVNDGYRKTKKIGEPFEFTYPAEDEY